MTGRAALQSIFLGMHRPKIDLSVPIHAFFARNSSRSGALVCYQQPPSAMKSKKNLTRFTYENAAFEGWRLCISRAGTTFTKYFPDKKFGGGKKSLAAAEKTLAELKTLVD